MYISKARLRRVHRKKHIIGGRIVFLDHKVNPSSGRLMAVKTKKMIHGTGFLPLYMVNANIANPTQIHNGGSVQSERSKEKILAALNKEFSRHKTRQRI